MRGSVFVKLRIWIVLRNGNADVRSYGIEYGHSAVSYLNTNYQQEEAFIRARNQAIKQYRNNHKIGSDTEINYRLLASGVINKREIRGKQVRNINRLRLKPTKKRELHKMAFLGTEMPLKEKDVERQIAREEYEKGHKKEIPKRLRRTKMKETEKYEIETGEIHKVKSKQPHIYKKRKPPLKIVVKRKNIRKKSS